MHSHPDQWRYQALCLWQVRPAAEEEDEDAEGGRPCQTVGWWVAAVGCPGGQRGCRHWFHCQRVKGPREESRAVTRHLTLATGSPGSYQQHLHHDTESAGTQTESNQTNFNVTQTAMINAHTCIIAETHIHSRDAQTKTYTILQMSHSMRYLLCLWSKLYYVTDTLTWTKIVIYTHWPLY